MLSPLARQLIRSFKSEPSRWEAHNRHVVRDDGVSIWIASGAYHGHAPRLEQPRQVEFSLAERILLARAIRNWRKRAL